MTSRSAIGPGPEPTGEAAFLRRLFGALRGAKILHAAMRNYESLPESAGSGDLDLIVPRADGARARAAVLEAVEASGAVVVGSVAWGSFFRVAVLGAPPAARGPWWGLQVDLNCGVSFQGVPYVADDRLADFIADHRGVPVLSPPLAAVLGFLKELLHNAVASERYRPRAALAAADGWQELAGVLQPLGESGLVLLRRALLEELDADAVRAVARGLRSRLRSRALTRAPARALAASVDHVLGMARRVASPPGVVIAVLGVDGTGKSTVLRAVEPALQAATHGAFHVRHLRPSLLPTLARLLKRDAGLDEGAETVPHDGPPSGLLGSVARLGYYTADYIVGHWAVARPSIVRKPAVWVYDRYAYDMALDPLRFRIRAPHGLIRLFTWAAPKPALIICLVAEASTIARRKQELPGAEIERQLEVLRRFAAAEPRAVLLSAEGTELEVRDRFFVVLQDFLRRRQGRGIAA